MFPYHKRLTINEAYAFEESFSGIFADLQKLNVPWAGENIASELDFDFHGTVAGEKFIIPFIERLAKTNDGVLSADDRTKIAKMLVAIYGTQWEKQWVTRSFEYNPIENYDMTEDESATGEGNRTTSGSENRNSTVTETMDHTGNETGSSNRTMSDSGSTNRTDTETGTTEHTDTGTIDRNRPITVTKNTQTDTTSDGSTANGVYGFDSEESAPSDTQTANGTTKVTVSDNTETQDNETETHNLTAGDTVNKKIQSEEIKTGSTRDDTLTGKNVTDKDERSGKTTDEALTGSTEESSDQSHRVLTRHGNIGVTTSQQMIQSERDLWLWNFFYDVVFPDITKTLALSVY